MIEMLLYCVFLGTPVILTVYDLLRLFNVNRKNFKYTSKKIDFVTVIWGAFLTLTWVVFCGEEEWNVPVTLGGGYSEHHTPISGEYGDSYFVLWILAIVSVLVLSAHDKRKPPVITSLLIGFVYIGNILLILLCIQLAKNGFLAVPPAVYAFNFLLVTINAVKKETGRQLEYLKHNECSPKNKAVGELYRFLDSSNKWVIAGFAAMLPILALLLIVLILCGQGADGLIKAFTITADWTFSKQIPPPPVQYEGHYLCTVAAGGHERIVKPTRLGIRQNTKIIVNRQLCIANAFEDFISEKTPRFHRAVREFYDDHGYPMSQKITTKARADMVYILMKPLEWLFLLVLYTFDTDPESRISVQYTGRKLNDFK